MNLKDKLQIYLITYNRKEKLKKTLEVVLGERSPIKDFDITILDNASNDGTSELIEEYCTKFLNIKHTRHPVNIGGNANICRAFEMAASCNKEYAWILCDDDVYDFSNWTQVENYIEQDKDIICVSDYVFPSSKEKENKEYQIFQMTFVPSSIFKTKNITDAVLMNMYDSIIMMFQQSCLTLHVINNNGEIVVLDKPIVYNGMHFEKTEEKDVSYVRGTNEEKEILSRRKNTSWILGFSNVLSLLKDKNLREKCMEVAIPYKDIYGCFENFYYCMNLKYFNKEQGHYFLEIYNVLPKKRKKEIMRLCFIVPLKYKIQKFFQWFFALQNTKDKKHKKITVFGFKIKIKRK